MKKLILLTLMLWTGLTACHSQQKNGQTANTEPPAVTSIPEKGYQDISVEEFKSKMKMPNTVILDVRTPEEVKQGMIQGAKVIDFRSPDFQEKIAALDRDKTYLVYCRSGNRSGQACRLMSDMGFRHLYNLQGGYLQWRE